MSQIHISNIEDFKDRNGNWVKSYTIASKGIQTVYHTRSSTLWISINSRCNLKNLTRPRYQVCSVDFEDYQNFTDWANMQYGYMIKEPNGRFWSLDKDLKVEGNKIYGPETCMFVPNRINNLFNIKSKDNGLPCGVSLHGTNLNSYSWSCSDAGYVHRGVSNCPLKAHKAWQLAKITILEKVLSENKYGELISEVISNRLCGLRNEYDSNLETKHWRFK